MKALRCDRCKGFFEQKGVESGRTYKIKRVSSTASRYEKSLDLCPKCEEKLKAWMEAGKKEGGKE